VSLITAPLRLLNPVTDRLDLRHPVYDTSGKTILVTGANTGIGLETAVGLAKGGGHVVITARDDAKGRAALDEIGRRAPKGSVDLMHLDLASFASVRRFAEEFRSEHERLDVLVNNAGLILGDRRVTDDGNETTFQVNHLGPFLLTNLLLDLIKASAPSRIVNVSSVAHRQGGKLDFDDLHSERGYTSMRTYGRTKLMNILFTRELARRLEGTGVTTNALHPGSIRSGFGKEGDLSGLFGIGIQLAAPFLQSSKQGARTSIELAASPKLDGVTGQYFAYRRRYPTSAAGRDGDAARRLWDVSEKLVGLA
jgi:retinol dehydrogenase 12